MRLIINSFPAFSDLLKHTTLQVQPPALLIEVDSHLAQMKDQFNFSGNL